MSLINEALKKAQRQRTEDPAAVSAPQPPPLAPVGTAAVPVPRIAKRRPPMPARTQVLLLIGSIAVLVMGGVLAFLFLASPPPPPPVAKPVIAKPVAPTPPPPVVVAPQPVVAIPAIVPKPEPTPPPLAKPAVPVPVANPKVYEFLENLRVAGIRVSDTDPKVIMNDRVFRLNDLVDRATQLRLIRVDASTLTFVDASGYEYKKNF